MFTDRLFNGNPEIPVEPPYIEPKEPAVIPKEVPVVKPIEPTPKTPEAPPVKR